MNEAKRPVIAAAIWETSTRASRDLPPEGSAVQLLAALTRPPEHKQAMNPPVWLWPHCPFDRSHWSHAGSF